MTWAIGASTGCCLDRPILDVLDAIGEGGAIRGVELGTPPRHFDPWQQVQVRAVHERLRAKAIAPISIHAPFGGLLDLSDPNPHHRNAAIGGILTAAAALRELGGSIVVVHTTDVPRVDQDVEQRLAHCADALSVLARACGHMAIRLAIESPLPHLIGGHPDEFAWILEKVGTGPGVCLDTAHTTLGHHWRRFLEVAAGRLIHVHANDHRGQFDDHLPPGDGVIDWREIGDTLREAEYDGWIMLELKCPEEPLTMHLSRAYSQAVRLFA